MGCPVSRLVPVSWYCSREDWNGQWHACLPHRTGHAATPLSSSGGHGVTVQHREAQPALLYRCIPMLRSCGVPLTSVEICLSCGGVSGTQVSWISTNCSHHQKVLREEENMLLKGQKLSEVELSPGHCTWSPAGMQLCVGMEVRCCLWLTPPQLRRQQVGDFAIWGRSQAVSGAGKC